jgi:glutathione reductase (NADPH)
MPSPNAPTDAPFDYDLFVIGAGSGGLAAAKRAAAHGARVGIAEADRVGGTCVIRGCVPKKLMVYAAQLGTARALAADFGWPPPAEAAGFGWSKLCSVRDQVVGSLEVAHQKHLRKAGVDCVAAHAYFIDPHTLGLRAPPRGNPAAAGSRPADRQIRARQILIACGGTPVLPKIPGSELALCSDDFFTLRSCPKRAVLIGGGYIAVEFAGILAALGAQTTLVVRSTLLRGFDVDLCASLRQAMRTAGIELLEHTQPVGLRPAAGGEPGTAHLEVESGATDSRQRRQLEAAACVLFAVGRRPNTAKLRLENAGATGVACRAGGAIEVDAHHRSSVPHIAAIGDVIDRVNLTPMAIRAGRAYADRLFADGTAQVDYANVPTAVFSQPPIGTVGLTEAQAKKEHGDAAVAVYKARCVPLRYAASPPARKQPAVLKVLVLRDTDRVLGIHILGDDAPEIIQGFAAAMQAGLTKAQLDATPAVHPSLAEELVLMR